MNRAWWLSLLIAPSLCGCSGDGEGTECGMNQTQISFAIQNYYRQFDGLPDHIRAPDGTPLLSWRVAILPFMEQSTLWNSVNMNEPWDGPTNRALLSKIPSSYRCPGHTGDPEGTTRYHRASGKGSLFDGPTRSFGTGDGKVGGMSCIPGTIEDASDGRDTIATLVELDKSVPWTKPEDLSPAEAAGSLALSFDHGGTANVVFLDHAVRRLPSKLGADQLREMITRRGGEAVNVSQYPTYPKVEEYRRSIGKFASGPSR